MVNIPRDFVSGNIHQYPLRFRRIIVNYHTQSVISFLYTTIIPDLQRLKAVMEQRAKAFVNYRHFIAIRAKFFFQMMLSQRGYNGKMSFDHGSEILVLQVGLILFFLF